MKQKIKWIKTGQKGDNVELLTIDLLLVEGFIRNYKAKQPIGSLRVTGFRQYDGCRWIIKRDIDSFLQTVKREEIKDPKFILKSFQAYERRFKKVKVFFDKFKHLNPSSLTNKELTELLNQYGDQAGFITPYVYNYVIYNKFLPDRLVALLVNKVSDINLRTKYFQILTSAVRISDFRLSQEALLRMVVKIKNEKISYNNPKLKHYIQSWLTKYAYFGFYYFYGKPLTEADIIKRLGGLVHKDYLKELQAINEQKKYTGEVRRLFRKLDFSQPEIILVNTLRQIAYCTNTFDEMWYSFIYQSYGFWNEIARRIGLSYDQLSWTQVDDIKNLLVNNKRATTSFKQLIKERIKDHVLLFDKGKKRLLLGKQLSQYKKDYPREKINKATTYLKGQSASPGYAVGTAKILHNIGELDKVKKGDILIAATTTPAHVPAMERAAAIVTEEGGLLCHAAIVSREMNIPCVIGTKIATKVLKDGDLVEVDAYKGIVRKI